MLNALITGPARGIGEALARELAARGARIALVGMEPERLEALARELGPRHVWFECDVTDQQALVRAVEGSVRELGGLDVVVANAGIASNGTVAITPMEALARVVEVNLTGVIRTVHATLPHVTARRGYYLLVSSAAAIAAAPGLATYSATKSGVEQFGNALRLELQHKGVDVGVAHPSWVDTDLVRDTRTDLSSFEHTLRRMPGPFGVVTPVGECAKVLADGIERRARKIYIPKSLGLFSIIRHLFTTKWVGRQMVRHAHIEAREAEVLKLGRVFGEHSVERDRPRVPDVRT
jgi:NAD(P)-dependent dehydrogenase (short-subunit alcohol dehydrogenase family)